MIKKYLTCPACKKVAPDGTATERRPNGNTTCGGCDHVAATALWDLSPKEDLVAVMLPRDVVVAAASDLGCYDVAIADACRKALRPTLDEVSIEWLKDEVMSYRNPHSAPALILRYIEAMRELLAPELPKAKAVTR